MKNMKKLLSLVLALVMVFAVAACQKPETSSQAPAPETTKAPVESSSEAPQPAEVPTYTYYTYQTSLGVNWNPHAWETSAESSMLSPYLTSPFVAMQALDTEEGVYQWVFDMAEIFDVTADHKDDLVKFGVMSEEDAANATDGYVYKYDLNKKACWQDGTPINADTYIYSMKALLDPAMHNYRANNYYSGDQAIAGAYDYYWAGSIAENDNGVYETYAFADLVKGDDGVYKTAEGYDIFWAVNYPLDWLSGNTLKDYYEAYGDAYFGTETWDDLVALADEDGLVPITDETYRLIAGVTTTNEAWGESEDDLYAYMMYKQPMPEVNYDDTVGCYKVDDYTIIVVYANQIPSLEECYYYNSDWPWIVYEKAYEEGKDTSGELVTTDYNTTAETTWSYGPYKIESLQEDKQLVFVQNENWWGWEKDENGTLVSYTPYEVNGEHVQRYQTQKVVIDVMDDDAAKQAFLKGELNDWAPPADELVTYAASDQLYKADETYTMSFFFHTNVDDLKVMDQSKGNINSVVLSNTTFRKAFSLAINREEWVTATAGYTPTFGILNNLYYYNFFKDPASTYRSSEPAMQAICNIYDVQYGAGTPYATLKDAYKSINGYNLTMAKELMKQACQELVADGLYTEGSEIKIRIGYKKGALDSSENKQGELMNKYINAAAEGSGFGKITLEIVGNCPDRYGDTAKGEFAIGYGAWGGAALLPFTMFRVYCDDDYVSPIHEAGCWDPATETLTLNINDEEVTMTWKEWSNSMSGTGKYSQADAETKLKVLAAMEENYLAKFYRIPLATSTACSLMSFKADYITKDYNFAYGWGGFELMHYNYSDAEWTEFVKSQNGSLNYE